MRRKPDKYVMENEIEMCFAQGLSNSDIMKRTGCTYEKLMEVKGAMDEAATKHVARK